MGSLANMVEGDRKGLPHEVMGLPALNLDTMQGAEIPAEYDITKVLGDTLMCEIIDEAKNGEVLRGGIYINQDLNSVWILGGNQANMVNISFYAKNRILGIRRLRNV
jgi:hypothetical protein